MDADLQRRFEALGFLPGDVKVEQESSVEMPKDLNDLYSNPEVSNIRISSHQPENSGAWLAEVGQSLILKESADQAFATKNYRKAVDLYTKAFEASTPSTSIELKRTILANRAQTYIFYGDIHTALQDVNLALSPQYTLRDSSKSVTMKCHFRRAKLFCMFARYEEALLDFEEFAKLRRETNSVERPEEIGLKKDIDEGVRSVGGRDRQRKDELMRAVDSRGIILRDNYRSNFPLPPRHILPSLGPDFDPDDMCLGFDTGNGRANLSLVDPTMTPIAIPVYIVAPYFHGDPGRGNKFFRHREEHPVSENDTIESLLGGLFVSVAMAERTTFSSYEQETLRSVAAHSSPSSSVVYIQTFRGRFLIVPRETTFKELFAGARWPRDGPLAFEDARETPRKRDFEVDGVVLGHGWFIEVWVIPKDKWKLHCQSMDEGLGKSGTV